ncbi:hypothetical protein Emed_006448 [Eimeria media]
MVAAAAALAAVLAVAYLVLRCFRAIGKTYLTSYSSRLLPNDNHEGDDCTVSGELCGFRCPNEEALALFAKAMHVVSSVGETIIHRVRLRIQRLAGNSLDMCVATSVLNFWHPLKILRLMGERDRALAFQCRASSHRSVRALLHSAASAEAWKFTLEPLW